MLISPRNGSTDPGRRISVKVHGVLYHYRSSVLRWFCRVHQHWWLNAAWALLFFMHTSLAVLLHVYGLHRLGVFDGWVALNGVYAVLRTAHFLRLQRIS